jgi:Protein of unknown function (DUF3604)
MKNIVRTTVAALTLGAAQIICTQPTAAANAPTAQRNAYFGDLHLHTSYSFDAYIMFASRVTPEQAYRFAKGEPIAFLDKTVKRAEPLDFLAVTDHSENIGVFRDLDDPNSDFSRTELGQRIRKEGAKAFWDVIKLQLNGSELPGFDARKVAATAWQHEIDAANSQYEPGKFTTFIGYEWTSMPDGKYNLHRNVLFSGDKAPLPFSSAQSRRPEDLWSWLEAQRGQGYDVLAVSHNANASGGLMFGGKDSDGKLIDEAYALRRVLNEPLTEISQGKGASETHPVLSPNDEFAGFEIFDRLLIGNVHSEEHGSYAREALGQGLEIGARTGVNPYRFGFVGGTDFHDGLSTSAENAYGGENNGIDPRVNPPSEEELKKSFSGNSSLGNKFELVRTGSGNITGVWAEQNTRESIFAALHRKETFATSGPRIKLRFFGGWDYNSAVLKTASWDQHAYSRGVAMGGELPARPAAAKAPRFIVWGLKDPNGANLDRAQVVKVWLGKNGAYAEKVFDVALSNGRKVDPATGKAPAVGNTVDLKTASYTNDVGVTELGTVWEDPQFDPSVPAVYYLRVVEIPTPRWSTILAVKRGLPLPPEVQPTLQERAWSSPVWYTPAALKGH